MLLPAIADVVVVLVFVVIGRRSHEEGEAVAHVLGVAAPFLLGLAAGWGASRAWRRPLAVRTGVAIWAVTLVVGMLLRRLVFQRGVAVSFVIVAGVFLALGLVGWRAVAAAVRARRQPVAAR